MKIIFLVLVLLVGDVLAVKINDVDAHWKKCDQRCRNILGGGYRCVAGCDTDDGYYECGLCGIDLNSIEGKNIWNRFSDKQRDVLREKQMNDSLSVINGLKK
jgi:hypothetical protein